jgi:hypothetical protein
MSDTVRYIFGFSEFVEGVGKIYPVQMKNYDDFMNTANIICLSYDHFDVEAIKKEFNKEDVKLFDLIILLASQSEYFQWAFLNLPRIFSYILRKSVNFNEENIAFETDDGFFVNRDNYEEIREVIMRQNLLYTPKVYKNKKLQVWAEKVLKARAKNSLDTSIEDMISTIAVISSKHYKALERYSIYQIRQEFNRIMKIESYRNAIAFRCAGDDKTKIEHYAETMDMFKNPYDDLFKEKSTMTNINAAVKGGKK